MLFEGKKAVLSFVLNFFIFQQVNAVVLNKRQESILCLNLYYYDKSMFIHYTALHSAILA